MPSDIFDELKLTLDRSQRGGYTLRMCFRVAGNDASQPSSRYETTLNPKDLRTRWGYGDHADYEKRLRDQLFSSEEARRFFSNSLAQAQGVGKSLRIQIAIEPDVCELQDIVWEVIHDPRTDRSLATTDNVWFSRYLTSQDPRPVQPVPKNSLQAMVMVANPSDLPEYGLESIDAQAEIDRVLVSLKEAEIRTHRLPDPDKKQRATLQNLISTLRNEEIDVVYLVCHGRGEKHNNQEPYLYLEDKDGRTSPITAKQLADSLTELTKFPRLIILVSCESAGKGDLTGMATALGPILVEAGVPSVLAMYGSVSTETIEHFMPVFLSELLRDGQIDRALSIARSQIKDRYDIWAPILFLRSESGKLWSVSPDQVNESKMSQDDTIYRETLQRHFAKIGVLDPSWVNEVDDIFVWPDLLDLNSQTPSPKYCPRRRVVNLKSLLQEPPQNIIISASAGFGKTTLLTAIAHHYASSKWLPVFISLPELAETRQTVLDFLEKTINKEFSCVVSWKSHCESEQVLLLLDGLDELSPTEQREMIKRISLFLSRYPKVIWILTVRDMSTITELPKHQKFTIEPLELEQIERFVKIYQKAGSKVDGTEFFSQLHLHPDLMKLARIPFFLALFLATPDHSQLHCDQRSEIIDCYLNYAFRPGELPSSSSIKLRNDPNDLQELAERIAFTMIKNGKENLTQAETASLIRDFIKSDSGSVETYITDLVICGILKRLPPKICFVFPIIQEYMAACYLVSISPEQILECFRSTRQSRYQFLQFFLEKYSQQEHSQVDQLIHELLSKPDDAVASNLKLISRAIIEGAKVTDQTRSMVGDRLAEIWESGSWMVQMSIGAIIASGFCTPLPSRVRSSLTSPWRLSTGSRPEIIASCKDPTLTLEYLKAYLTHSDLSSTYYLHGWQSAVDAIAPDAIKLYLERARGEKTTDKEIVSLARLISQITSKKLALNYYRIITDDNSLPSVIRLAGYFLGPRPFSEDFHKLADEIIRTQGEENRLLAIKALWNGVDEISRWSNYVNDPTLTLDQRREILASILDSPLENEGKRNSLSQLALSGPHSDDLADLIQLLLSYLGDEQVMRALTGRLASLSYEHLSIWATILNKYYATDIAYVAVPQLNNLKLEDWQKARLAETFACSLTSDIEFYSLYFWSSYGSRIHSSALEYAKMIWQWADTFEGDIESSLILLKSACQLGQLDAADRLTEKLISCLKYPELFQYFDNTYSNALSVLRDIGRTLPLAFLVQCIMISDSNAKSTAIGLLALYKSQEALDALLQLYAYKTDDFAKDQILVQLEELAKDLGVHLVWKDDRLISI